MLSLMHTVCTTEKLYQPLKFNHRVTQRPKWSLECNKGSFRAILCSITSFLVGRFDSFTGWWRTEGSQQFWSVYQLNQWLHIPLQSVYMRCIDVFRDGAPLMRETYRDRAYKMKALKACVFIRSCLLSMMDPVRPQAPGICIANRPHISLYFFP